MTRTLVFATNNPHKLREIREIMPDHVTILSLADIHCEGDIPETADTLEGNALIKAHYVYDRYGFDCFADDTGLEVDSLGGAPGVYTARYAGEDKDFNKNMDKVLQELAIKECEASFARAMGLSVRKVSRKARFKSVITLIFKGQKHFFEGVLEGTIARTKSGKGGFGYDPIFLADDYPGLTLADVTEEQKNAISHRGKALRAMSEWFSAGERQ